MHARHDDDTATGAACLDPADIQFTCSSFDELGARGVHELLALRMAVFVVEQSCPYQDIDGRDPDCLHLLGRDRDGKLVACARLVPPGVAFAEPSVGRIATHRAWRGRHLGQHLIREALARLERRHPGAPVRIAAQCHLLDYYRQFGFAPVGEQYVWDGIPHQDMLRPGAAG
jgi:ElaA protein